MTHPPHIYLTAHGEVVPECDHTHGEAFAVRYVRDDGWQPIETAPKDGTPIMATSEYRDVSIVRWQDGDWRGLCDGEMSIASQGDTFTEYHRPFCQFWQPLPAPPKETEQ